MNVHKNARLTPHGREQIVKMVQSGQPPQAVAGADIQTFHVALQPPHDHFPLK